MKLKQTPNNCGPATMCKHITKQVLDDNHHADADVDALMAMVKWEKVWKKIKPIPLSLIEEKSFDADDDALEGGNESDAESADGVTAEDLEPIKRAQMSHNNTEEEDVIWEACDDVEEEMDEEG